MKFSVGSFCGALLVVLSLVSGCLPAGSGPLDEEKEPHFLAGKNRVSTLDYAGAIECFEKALQVNPQSASAHFELACLFDERELEPATAIYHYEHYLKLRHNAQNADVVNQRITACKQALAKTVSLGPLTDKMQRQFEQVAEENKRLTEETNRLHEELQKWSVYAARLQTLTNRAPAPLVPVRSTSIALAAATPTPVTSPARPADTAVMPPSTTASPSRKHIVKTGETPFLIAKKYGVKLDALMAANPSLDPRRMRVGQSLHIPGS